MDSKLLDHQTRRVLHDDILPEIHTIMIGIDSMQNESVRVDLLNSLTSLHKKISNLLKILPFHPTDLSHVILFQKSKLWLNQNYPRISFLFLEDSALEKLQYFRASSIGSSILCGERIT